MKACYQKIQSGARNYIRSDIESFFTLIPKPTIVSTIRKIVADEEFLKLFESAITTELANLADLGKEKEAFPIYDIGVAQGSCLSPLLGNILLSEFDREMNVGDISCYRYIDDFIILAPTERAANAAFKRGLKLLNSHGLTAYDPKTNNDKAELGKTSGMFTFLGCDIRPGMIRPNKKSKRRLIDNIDQVFGESIALMRDPVNLIAAHRTVAETLSDVSNILQGWGNQYSFCNDAIFMRQIDETVDKKIATYLSKYSNRKDEFEKSGQPENTRRLLGVHLLCDSKKAPIVV
ncbi:MAG: RNA-directed DNA polymerase [Gammaproteobacteria bacterium]|nr:MAG: RNA-directed DNA polymerase [Gammaproteobacteria bacterium]TND04468.1 MAG: RNA-directed DNA polymerase [Gammaproteobacteria bacterium]